MYLAITLSKLDDYENSCAAYEKAIEMESDHLCELNYAITLYNHGQMEAARHHFIEFEKMFEQLSDEDKNSDPSVVEKRQRLASVLL